MNLLVINGPNLNFLGIREKSVYGTQDYHDLLTMIGEKGREKDCQIEVFQSNHEGAIIDRIQDAYRDAHRGLSSTPALLHITAMPYGMRWHPSPCQRLKSIFRILQSGKHSDRYR